MGRAGEGLPRILKVVAEVGEEESGSVGPHLGDEGIGGGEASVEGRIRSDGGGEPAVVGVGGSHHVGVAIAVDRDSVSPFFEPTADIAGIDEHGGIDDQRPSTVVGSEPEAVLGAPIRVGGQIVFRGKIQMVGGGAPGRSNRPAGPLGRDSQ